MNLVFGRKFDKSYDFKCRKTQPWPAASETDGKVDIYLKPSPTGKTNTSAALCEPTSENTGYNSFVDGDIKRCYMD